MAMRLPIVLALLVGAAAKSVHLTPLLRAGVDVRGPSLVGPLPGISAASFAGYFEVDAAAGAELFFWYWPPLNGNASAPLIVWLQGGPGSSSLFGMFAENGPYRLSSPTEPVPNPFTWAQENHIVYLDNPRGTGYSYAAPGHLCTDWKCYGNDFDVWIRQFVAAYSLTANPMFITGESYGAPPRGWARRSSSFVFISICVLLQGVTTCPHRRLPCTKTTKRACNRTLTWLALRLATGLSIRTK